MLFKILKTKLLILLACATLGVHAQQFTDVSHMLPDIDSLDCQCAFGRSVSFADVDMDGWPDLTFAASPQDSVFLYKNNQGTSFTRIPLPIPQSLNVKMLLWVDLDNDGDRDFVASMYNDRDRIYRCDSAFTYTDITTSSGFVDYVEPSSGVSAADVNRDGYLDLFIAVRGTSVEGSHFYINNGDMTFTEKTEDYNITLEDLPTFNGVFVDFDRDGWQDLYLINDRYAHENILYKNINGEYFEDVSAGSGADIAIDAMDSGIGDFNQDGWMDIYISNTPPGNVLLKNTGGMHFTDYTDTAGVGFYRIGWGGNFFDADNDNDLDLHACSMEGTPADPNSMYFNQGPPDFEFDETTIPGDTSSSFAEAVGDFNDDGFIDMVILNNTFFSHNLWKNDGSSGLNWIKVRLEGTESNRDGVGAHITAKFAGKTRHNYVCAGEAYLAQNDFTEHFGLDSADIVDTMLVYWPNGIIDTFFNLPANQTHILVEGSTPLDSMMVSGSALKLDSLSPGVYEVICSGDIQDTVSSQADGTFQLMVAQGDSVVLTPYKDDNWTEGVSIVDLVEILQHITQSDLLDSPYEIIAADANASETVSISDLVVLLQLITGNLSEIDGNTSYRFIPSDYQFADPANPLAEDFPESVIINEVNGPVNVDFKAVKTGDVNY